MNRKTKKELIILAGLFVILIIVIRYQLVEIKKTLYPEPLRTEDEYIHEDISLNLGTYVIDFVYTIPNKPYVTESSVVKKSKKLLWDFYHEWYKTLPKSYQVTSYRKLLNKAETHTELAFFTIPYKSKVVKQFLYKVTIGMDELYFDPKTGELRAWHFFKAGFRKKLPV